MKKVFISLIATALLFSACGSNENPDTITHGQGDLVAKINFEGITTKAASSTAVPKTTWGNVNKIQMFLYDEASGKVAFSAIIDPADATGSPKEYKWTNVPAGRYELALVANINSATGEDNVATSLDNGVSWMKFDAYNVVNKILNSDIFIDLKESAFPTTGGHTFETGDVPYAPASEIFTAYRSPVNIVEGGETNLSDSPLKLMREISLMRVRINKTDKEDAPALSTVDFANASNFIAIHNMPVGIGLKATGFEGGIYPTPSDKNRIMIAASGVGTYENQNPDPAGYDLKDKGIIYDDYTLWKDIRVLPNATKADGKATNEDADAARKYFIVIAAMAPQGYVYADGSVAVSGPKPVYWSGTINGVFSPNIIREVNLNITSKGFPGNPENPDNVGGLIITVDSPEDWNSNIESEDINI